MANKPTVEWDEGNPAGSQEKSLGGLRLREMRTQIREIIGEDHHFSLSGQGSTWGFHGKLMFYTQTSDPILDTNTGCLYAKDDLNVNTTSMFWVDEKDNIIQLTQAFDFIGGMSGEVRMYYGLYANIPTGWSLCDGSGSTPNLVGKMIRGTDSAEEAGTSHGTGVNSQTLITANLYAHTHSIPLESASHTHSIPIGTGAGSTGYEGDSLTGTGTGYTVDEAMPHSHTTSSAGSGTSYDNRPAYVEEGFIIKD